MEKSVVNEDILKAQAKINNKIKNIIESKDKVSKIEIDIVLADIRNLYSLISDYNDLIKEDISFAIINDDSFAVAESKKVNSQPIAETVIINDSKNEPIIEELEEDKAEQNELLEEESIIEEEIKIEVSASNENNSTKEKLKEIGSQSIDLFSMTQSTVADKLKEDRATINDQLSVAKPDNTVSEKISKQKIVDLKSSIGINEKFMFINQLFKGSLDNYNEAMDYLENYDIEADAFDYINRLAEKYKWDKDNIAVVTLNELIKRKYN